MSVAPTRVILSSGVVAADLVSEVGPVTSGQVPMAGRPLLARLLEQAPTGAPVIVSLRADDVQLRRLVLKHHPGATILTAASDQPLLDVVAAALDLVGAGPVHLTFGDTLGAEPEEDDEIQIGAAPDLYRWTTVERLPSGALEFRPRAHPSPHPSAVIGAFAMSDAASLRDALGKVPPGTPEPLFAGLAAYEELSGARFTLRPVAGWLDFGHLDTFHEARRTVFAARRFNCVTFDAARNSIRKASTDRLKIRLEAEWFESLGGDAESLAPRLLGVGDGYGSYEIQYLPLVTVAEAYVCGHLDLGYWQRFLAATDRCLGILHDDRRQGVGSAVVRAAAADMFVDKPLRRLTELRASPHSDRLWCIDTVNGRPVPTLDDVCTMIPERVAGIVDAAADRFSRVHGDLFFGNMFFDRRADRVLLVDPRGSFGFPGAGGDRAYDLCKLSHSMLGRYDFLVADAYDFDLAGTRATLDAYAEPRHVALERLFEPWLARHAEQIGLSMADIRVLEALCFISLAALHTESPRRQAAFVARGLEILGQWA